MCLMPNGASASCTALTTAGVDAMVPASPAPFTPSGFTGDGVTLEEADGAAEGVREVRRVVEGRGLEARLHPRRHAVREVRREADLGEALAAVGGSLHEELAVGEVHVLGRRLEQVRGEPFPLLLDLLDAHLDRRAAHRATSAAVGSH